MKDIRFKDMTIGQYNNARNKAEMQPSSPFAVFCLECKGFAFFKVEDGEKLEKWELWALGYRNPEALKSGQVPEIEARRK